MWLSNLAQICAMILSGTGNEARCTDQTNSEDGEALGLDVQINTKFGRDSHYIITVGESRTTIQSGEFTHQMTRTILKQLKFDD